MKNYEDDLISLIHLFTHLPSGELKADTLKEILKMYKENPSCDAIIQDYISCLKAFRKTMDKIRREMHDRLQLTLEM